MARTIRDIDSERYFVRNFLKNNICVYIFQHIVIHILKETKHKKKSQNGIIRRITIQAMNT